VNVYVPVNDTNISNGLELLPDSRARRARGFPSASLIDPDVYFVWSDTMPESFRGPLQRLLARTSSLGHSASLVAVEMVDQVPEHMLELYPSETGVVRLRVPSSGRLKELCERFVRFEHNPVKINRPGPGRTALYSGAIRQSTAQPKHSVFQEMIIFRRVRGEGMPLNGTYQLLAAMRGAMMSHAPQPCPEVISGHAPESTAERPIRSQRTHIALAPLAFVGSRHASGQILGIGALLPCGLEDSERDASLRALMSVKKLRMATAGVWEIEPASSELVQQNLRRRPWIRESRVWATITPFVFDRFPKDKYGRAAQDIVYQACERAGLPRPESVAIIPVSPHAGVPPSSRFAPAPARPGKPARYHQHLILSFAELVAGPVALGAGRYYGYGFCRPLVD
jgi:CRISPR-associated protein Csb2